MGLCKCPRLATFFEHKAFFNPLPADCGTEEQKDTGMTGASGVRSNVLA